MPVVPPPPLPKPPTRVVSLVPSVTETLCAFGLAGRVVGRTDFCVHPARQVAGIPSVGGTKTPNLDQVRALRPDLVIASQEENTQAAVLTLQQAGLTVWVTFPETVNDTLALLWDMVQVFRVPHLEPSITLLEKAVTWTELAAANAQSVPVFCPIWREPQDAAYPPAWWMTFNAQTYCHDVLRVCGAHNVFAGRVRRYPLSADLDPSQPAVPPGDRDTRYPRLTHAEVHAAHPQLILLPTEPYPFTSADVAAVQADFPQARVELVEGSWLTWPGIRLDLALRELPALINAPPLSAV